MDEVSLIDQLFRLSGRVAVVTGAGAGMGREIAIGLANAGAEIVVADIDQKGASETVATIGERRGRALAVTADVSSEVDVDRLFAEVDREFGRVDVLVNNAGTNVISANAEDYPTVGWEDMLRINLTSAFLCARAAGARMIAAGRGGSIVNISSVSGLSASNRGSLAFGAAKGGLIQLTRDLAVEWAPKGIRVNAIAPIQFRTSGWASMIKDPANDDLIRTVLHGIPLGRMGEPSEILGPVLFLASDAASMVTGVTLPVDGGNLAMNAGAGGMWPSRRLERTETTR